MTIPVGVLWCPNSAGSRANGWCFPRAVEKHLRELTQAKRVGQLFGGRASWGIRLDIDPTTRPDVHGDAWLPPFRRDAFDVVILDPPYITINQQMKQQLLRAAGFVAREKVIWFHTTWIAGDGACRLERGWLVRVGNSCAVRCIQVFASSPDKTPPRPYFTRGPAVKYNRWINGPGRLPLE